MVPPISDAVAVQMRLTARGIFAHLLSEKSAPAKWGQVSVVSQDFFFNVMAERYPFAAMCEDMWKMQLLATTCYPSWHRNNKKKVAFQQREQVWIDQQLEHGRQLKEEVIEQVDLAAKRMRSGDDVAEGSESRPSKKCRTSTHRTDTEKIRAPRSSSGTSQSLSSSSRSFATPANIAIPKPLSSRAAESVSTTMGSQLSNPIPSRDLSIPPPLMVSEQSVTSGGESQQVSEPLSSTESIPSVENWAYDRTGLDSTNTQETALDRLSVHDSTPYIVVSPLDEQQISSEMMPLLSETPSMDMPPLREDAQVRDHFLLSFMS